MRREVYDVELSGEYSSLRTCSKNQISQIIKDAYDVDFVSEVFDEFEYQALSSGSIAQVHKAKIQGIDVVVKIVKPGIAIETEVQLAIFKACASVIYYLHVLRTGSMSATSFAASIFECIRVVEQEYDMHYEEYKRNLVVKSNQNVYAPFVYSTFTRANIIVMEYIHGQTIAELISYKSENRTALAKDILDLFVEQVFINHVFHGDWNPGNIIVQDGKIYFIDFGYTNAMDTRQGFFITLFFALFISKDFLYAANMLRLANFLKDEDVFLTSCRLSVIYRNMYNNIIQKGSKNTSLSSMIAPIVEFITNTSYRPSGDLMSIKRNLLIIEGICHNLDSELSAFEYLCQSLENFVHSKEFKFRVFKFLLKHGDGHIIYHAAYNLYRN